MKYQTGLVLSGGGARGFAHLGIIQALSEKGIKPDVISGVSAGAIVGAFIASGRPPHEVHQLLKNKGLLKYSKIHLPVDGLLRLDGLKEVLAKEIPYARLEELPIPLFVGISNLNEGRVEYHNRGELPLTVLASASIPILFSPVEINGCQYVDGGLFNNIPTKPIENDCHRLIVSNIHPLDKSGKLKNMVQIAVRTFHLSILSKNHEARKKADIFIEPEELSGYEILDIKHADEVFEVGYNAVKKLDPTLFETF